MSSRLGESRVQEGLAEEGEALAADCDVRKLIGGIDVVKDLDKKLVREIVDHCCDWQT
jgi:methyl coenzyme M reductase alpha subunit